MSRPVSGKIPPEGWVRCTEVVSVEPSGTGGGVGVVTPQGTIEVVLYADGTARLVMARPSSERLPEGMLNLSELSPLTPHVAETETGWVLSGGQATVQIEREPLAISVLQGQESIFSTLPCGLGFRRGSVWCEAALGEDTHLYGLGEKVGTLNKRGSRWTQWTTDRFLHTPNADPLYVAVPFVLLHDVERTAGVFLANAHRSYFESTWHEPERLVIGADGGDLDLFIFPGPLPALVERYSALTGRMPLPPLYAIGFQQSRHSYASEQEVREVARQFRDLDLPCDVLYLDIMYMDDYRVFTWDSDRFPDPERLIKELADDGFKVVPIIDPGVKVDHGYEVYREGQAREYFVQYRNGEEFQSRVWPGMCAFPDFLSEGARSWWGDLHRPLIAQGVGGIWNDMNEPAWNRGGVGHYGHDNDGDVVHRIEGSEYSHAAVHNLYATAEARATFEALESGTRSVAPDGAVVHERPFVLSRSGFAGIQRYAAVWTGDNCSWWEHLAQAIPMCLNLGLSGVPFVGPDLGGFQHDATPELYARWVEMGVFFPFLRAHSGLQTRRHEPWSFGEEVLAIAREYLGYRYRLLPYWYSLFYESTLSGAPPMRPLLWEAPGDPRTWDIDDQFLVGPALMVAPVTRSGVTERSVYLPSGVWYDAWERTALEGPCVTTVSAPLERIPVFLKAGTILPLGERVLSTSSGGVVPRVAEGTDGPREFLVIRGDGDFVVYSDDTLTDRYRSGEYRTIKVSVRTAGAVTTVGWEALHWPSAGSDLRGDLRVEVGYYQRCPASVTSRGTPLRRVLGTVLGAGEWAWDPERLRVRVTLSGSPAPGTPLDLVLRSDDAD